MSILKKITVTLSSIVVVSGLLYVYTAYQTALEIDRCKAVAEMYQTAGVYRSGLCFYYTGEAWSVVPTSIIRD